MNSQSLKQMRLTPRKMKYYPCSSHLLLWLSREWGPVEITTHNPGGGTEVRTAVLPHLVAPWKSHLTSSELLSPLWKKDIKWDSLSYLPALKVWVLPLTKEYSLKAFLKLTILTANLKLIRKTTQTLTGLARGPFW